MKNNQFKEYIRENAESRRVKKTFPTGRLEWTNYLIYLL